MKKRTWKRKMLIALGVLIVLAGTVTVWFHIPYSPVKNSFKNDIAALKNENLLQTETELFAKEDFSHLPKAIQKYIEHCGYIGTPKMSYLKMEYRDVTFMRGRGVPPMSIDYTQYNFVNEPCRMALIDSFMFGTPFEGCDCYSAGKGGMKGVIGKAITLFDVTGEEMDRACLATFLAECLFVPTVLLQDYINFEEISEFETKAVITYGGQSASGTFTFNENYEMLSFTTNDRCAAGEDGTIEYIPWSALCSEYTQRENGIKYPNKFQAVWNYPDEDHVYFDGVISDISYGYVK